MYSASDVSASRKEKERAIGATTASWEAERRYILSPGQGPDEKGWRVTYPDGAHVKCQVIPIWEGGKINRYTSPDFPVHQPRAQQQGLMTTPAPSQEHAYMEPPKSPVKDLISAAAEAEQSFAAAQKRQQWAAVPSVA